MIDGRPKEGGIGRSRAISALSALLTFLALIASCATVSDANYGIKELDGRDGKAREPRLIALPSTLVVTRDRTVTKSFGTGIALAAARGEAESAQLLYCAGERAELGLRLAATDLEGPGGSRFAPEIGVVAYVPLRQPSLLGFHRAGEYPDPIMPQDEFSVPALKSQALWYTVRVPRNAEAGTYSGSVSVVDAAGRESVLPVRLRVYDVELPKTSFLKTSVNFRRENARDERYYGINWSEELEEEIAHLGLAFRFSHRIDLPLLDVFSRNEEGRVVADWKTFDAKVAYWLDQGITCFELKLPITWDTSPIEIHKDYGRILESIEEHVRAKDWVEVFYFYFYDEPVAADMGLLRERLDAIREHAPSIRNVLTYGITTLGERELLGRVGIWVPNIHQYDPAFAKLRRGFGEESWVYVCVGNAFRSYPDNFRIDWYGTAHRALGWWLFKYEAQGFLYWAVDLWRRNPWDTTETFPGTNGDGTLFYPALDKKSAPYPSIRAHLMRDAFEDYDLLVLLKRAYAGEAAIPDEAAALLNAKGIILRPEVFATDDAIYERSHERILALLEERKGEEP